MVLADLGRRINSAFSQLNKAPVIDEKTLDALLKEIAAALLEADVNVKHVSQLRSKVKTRALAQLKEKDAQQVQGKGRQIVQKAVFDELVALVDPGQEAYKPKKGAVNVIMMVGLQGAGKTTTCTKLAVHYQRRGFKTCLVCADTFRAGAFDQLKQNATKAKIPFYGSYTETDPVAIAAAGVAQFRKSRFDVIIVDTSGRHKQEAELFEEMILISQAVEPNMTVLVMDGAIGQAAEAQSRAFKESSDFGAIIVTKMDGHAKGGGAISAVAATQTPIIFIGTGEHLHDLDTFRPQPFVQKMLGMGDMQGFIEHIQDVAMANPEKQKELAKKLESGSLSIRDWAEQIKNVTNMGPISKIAGMIPGLPADLLGQGGDEEASRRIKRMLFITDSMNQRELDSDGSIFLRKDKDGKPIGLSKRVLRVARGSGTSVREVEELLVQHRVMANMAKQAGGKNGIFEAAKRMQAGGKGMPTPGQIQQLQRSLPPGMLQKLRAGGPAAAQDMMRQMMSGNAPAGLDMNKMMQQMQAMGLDPAAMGGGMPGMGGGMPNMADMMKAMGGMGGLGGLANMFGGGGAGR